MANFHINLNTKIPPRVKEKLLERLAGVPEGIHKRLQNYHKLQRLLPNVEGENLQYLLYSLLRQDVKKYADFLEFGYGPITTAVRELLLSHGANPNAGFIEHPSHVKELIAAQGINPDVAYSDIQSIGWH